MYLILFFFVRNGFLVFFFFKNIFFSSERVSNFIAKNKYKDFTSNCFIFKFQILSGLPQCPFLNLQCIHFCGIRRFNELQEDCKKADAPLKPAPESLSHTPCQPQCTQKPTLVLVTVRGRVTHHTHPIEQPLHTSIAKFVSHGANV